MAVKVGSSREGWAVSGGDPRRGRRDNGLEAAGYVAAGDVDPRVGEHLLDVLALEGIAAYLHPAADLNPVTRTTLLPQRPTDRLFVDREHLDTARTYLAQLAEDAAADSDSDLGGIEDEEYDAGDASDVDDAWRAIVAGFDADTAPTWPSSEDVASPPEPGARRTRRVVGGEPTRRTRAERWRPTGTGTPARQSDEDSLLDGLDTFGADLPDEPEEGFSPPAPPPLPRPSLPTVLAVIGVVGGLIIFLRPGLLPFGTQASLFLGFAALISGFITLVWRLRHDEDDIDHDDGAVV
jgi:hypothetical protein